MEARGERALGLIKRASGESELGGALVTRGS
jgi:hypothetical protein